MSKRKITVHSMALKLASERLATAKLKHDIAYANIGSDTEFTRTVEDYYHDAVEFVISCRRATW